MTDTELLSDDSGGNNDDVRNHDRVCILNSLFSGMIIR